MAKQRNPIRIEPSSLLSAAGSDIKQILAFLGKDIEAKAVRKAAQRSAEYMRAEVVKRTPVRTGNLRNQMIVKPLRKRGSVLAFLVGAKIDGLEKMKNQPGYLEGVDRPAYYVLFIEEGFIKRTKKPRGRRSPNDLEFEGGPVFVEGRPFMEKSLRAAEPHVMKIFEDELEIYLRKLTK